MRRPGRIRWVPSRTVRGARRFGNDPKALGTTIQLNGYKGVTILFGPDLWVSDDDAGGLGSGEIPELL
jgi:hypothetical protein